MTFEQARDALRELYGERWFVHRCGNVCDVGYLLQDVGDVYDPTSRCVTGTGPTLGDAVARARLERAAGHDSHLGGAS